MATKTIIKSQSPAAKVVPTAKAAVVYRKPVGVVYPSGGLTVKQTGPTTGPLQPGGLPSVPFGLGDNAGSTGYSGLVLHGPGQGARVEAGQLVTQGLPTSVEDIQARVEESVRRLGSQLADFLVQKGGWIVALIVVILLMVVAGQAALKG